MSLPYILSADAWIATIVGLKIMMFSRSLTLSALTDHLTLNRWLACVFCQRNGVLTALMHSLQRCVQVGSAVRAIMCTVIAEMLRTDFCGKTRPALAQHQLESSI